LLLKYPGHFELLHQLGMVHGQRGDFAAAVAFIEQAIAADPNNSAAHGSLGNCLKSLGRHEEALASYDRALALQPDDANILSNRGATLGDLKRHEEALESYERALALDPHHVLALDNRGTTLRALQRLEEALASHDRALAINPDYASAHYNRGLILADLKRLKEARTSFEQALTLNPGHIDSLVSLGTVLHNEKCYEEALVQYACVLQLQPDHAETHINRGATLRELNRYRDALAAFDKALALRPDHTGAHFGRGVVLGDMNRTEEALASYHRVLLLQPAHVEALNNQGVMFRHIRREAQALDSFGKALAIDPAHVSSRFNRGHLLLELKQMDEAIEDFAEVVRLAPDYDYAQSHLLHAKMSCCQWHDAADHWRIISELTRQGKRDMHPYYCLGMTYAPDFQKRCAETYVRNEFPEIAPRQIAVKPNNSGRIRLGYLAGEFRRQATSILLVELIEKHDTGRFDVFAFDNGWDDDSPIRKRLARSFAEIVDISHMDDNEAASKVMCKKIDILINLNGYFGLGRTGVFSRRPAPLQVNWLGFPGTMGAPYMDYIIGDATVIPAGHESYYSEKVVRLPDSYQSNDSKRAIAESTPTRAEAGLPESAFVFCCFNNNFKITPEVFDSWMRLLTGVAHSVLWLLEDNPAASRNLRFEASVRGVSPDSLIFAPRVDLPEHLARHRLADLFLDTLPHNAHTTASDALWAGLPLITCMGTTFAGRVAASLLKAVGLPELITQSMTDYETLALKLATTPDLLGDFRSRLARNRLTSPLFDTDRFCSHIESAYTTMYERCSRGQSPQSFNVNALN
jgi:protein O-GlcNAc transferase